MYVTIRKVNEMEAILRFVLLITQYLSIIALIVEIIYISSLKPSKYQCQMILILCSTLIMLFGYTFELNVTDARSAMIGVSVAYLGKPYVLLLSFLFVANYCDRPISKKISIASSIAVLIFPLILITNGFSKETGHMLYYTTVDINTDNLFSPLVLSRGPLYNLYIAYMVLMFVLILFYICRQFIITKSNNMRHQLFWFFLMYALTIAGYLVYITGLSNGYDTTMTGAALGTFCLTVIFFKYKLFDSLTTAKEHALYNASTGLLVFNENNKIVYSNAKADEYLKSAFSVDELISISNGENIINRKETVYEVQKSPIEKGESKYGSTIEIEDITTQYNYNSRLVAEVNARTKEIRSIQRSVIASFAGIVEARDQSTGEHIKRISSFVELIANSLLENGDYADTLTPGYITRLVEVAPLHDVGKISIPDAILMKPGRLTPEEFDVIKTHSSEGARILREILDGVERPDYVALACDVAKYHHEKWDGSGYPEKRKGDKIPLAARIVAVADVYDAIRSERCYKPAMEREAARQVIIDSSGTHFDPVIVSAFLRVFDNLEA